MRIPRDDTEVNNMNIVYACLYTHFTQIYILCGLVYCEMYNYILLCCHVENVENSFLSGHLWQR
jgi:hypothetical protein